MPHRIHLSPCRSGHDPALTTVTHAAIRADERLWRSQRFVGLRLSDSQLLEVRRCPDCNTELLKPIGGAMALRMLMGRLANESVPNPILQSIQVLSQWADRLTGAQSKIPEAERHDADTVCIPIGTPLFEAEHQMVRAALKVCSGSRSETAKLLGLSRRTLYNKLQSLKRKQILTEPLPPPSRRKQKRMFAAAPTQTVSQDVQCNRTPLSEPNRSNEQSAAHSKCGPRGSRQLPL